MKNKHSTQPVEVNEAILNVITPMGLEFNRNNIYVGDNIGKLYGIIKYPPEVGVGWLSKINNMPSTIVCQTFTPTDNSELIQNISATIRQKTGEAESARDPLVRQRALKAVEQGENIMKQIDQNGETVGYVSNVIMVISNDEEQFQQRCRQTETAIASVKCKARGLANLQKEAFKAISPYHVPNEKIENVCKKLMPISTYCGGFPFASSSYSDGRGYYFAKDISGGMVAIDPWLRHGDRTNSNWVVMGVAGQGKSATTKHIITEEYAKGTKIIIIDPETEYKKLTFDMGADWLDVGGGVGGLINPLEIRPMPEDDDEETGDYEMNDSLRLSGKDVKGMGDLALHLKTLEIFFGLYLPEISDYEKAYLNKALRELYGNFGITLTMKLKDKKIDKYPTIKDLYDLLNENCKNEALHEDERENYRHLACLLENAAIGQDSFLWNNQTSIKPHSKWICLDTHSLQNSSEKVIKTQYFNILTWAWEQMSRDRTERVLLVCDEAYLMIDNKVPQSLVFLRNCAKRARKYEAGLMIISHSVVDFLDPSIKMYGQALLDIPCYKVLFGADGQNLKELSDLYNLTEAEKELLLAKKRAVALFCCGAKRLSVKFDLQHKLKYISGGGR
ncbi:VirB4 family type IV secretion system protein [Eubacterium sp.]|uniref:VirB4 family type IV secretion system protein n=1 Tax=Eubacterium sp. TaxID=142586 RepID=UPI003EFC11C2